MCCWRRSGAVQRLQCREDGGRGVDTGEQVGDDGPDTQGATQGSMSVRPAMLIMPLMA